MGPPCLATRGRALGADALSIGVTRASGGIRPHAKSEVSSEEHFGPRFGLVIQLWGDGEVVRRDMMMGDRTEAERERGLPMLREKETG